MRETDLTSIETLIMKCIWEFKGEMPLQTLKDELLKRFNKDYQRTTIRTYLTSLQHKGYLSVERKGKYSYAKWLIGEEEYRTRQAEKLLDFWFDGSSEKFVKALSYKISNEEQNRLKALLNDLEDEQ